MACILVIKEDINKSIDEILGGYRDATHSYKEAQRRSKEINDRWSNLSRVEKFGDNRAKVELSDTVFEKVANEALASQEDLTDEVNTLFDTDIVEELTTGVKNPDEVFDENPYEVSNIKPGVAELFESNPELSSIGTPEQYSQYLDTIFTDSKVKDIVYHGTNKDFSEFVSGKGFWGNAFYVTTEKGYANSIAASRARQEPGTSKIIKPLLINANNIEFEEDAYAINEFPENIDTILTNIEGGAKIIYAISKPEQIHILGGKQDINNFKQYVDTISIEQVEEEHPIQTAYKKELEKTGDKPKVIVTRNTKAILNDNGSYDLIDPSNNSVMQKNMNLDTMQIVEAPISIKPYDEKIFDSFVRDTLMHPYMETMLAERGIDISDVFDELNTIRTEDELNDIMAKILKSIC